MRCKNRDLGNPPLFSTSLPSANPGLCLMILGQLNVCMLVLNDMSEPSTTFSHLGYARNDLKILYVGCLILEKDSEQPCQQPIFAQAMMYQISDPLVYPEVKFSLLCVNPNKVTSGYHKFGGEEARNIVPRVNFCAKQWLPSLELSPLRPN